MQLLNEIKVDSIATITGVTIEENTPVVALNDTILSKNYALNKPGGKRSGEMKKSF